MKGPAVFLAQFFRNSSPFNSLEGLAKYMKEKGYQGLQIPTWEKGLMDLNLAADSKDYCDKLKAKAGIEICEIASYLQGQVMAISPLYQELFQGFYPPKLNSKEQVKWAQEQLKLSVKASVNLGTTHISVLSGGLAWPFMYPWPQRSAGLVEEAFDELAKRWLPILQLAQDNGITIGFELHPGSDLFDGATFQRFLEKVNRIESACLTYDPSHFFLQNMDYLAFIDLFHERIKAFHVKDAEFKPNGLTGVYGGYLDWKERAGRFRSLGDGQIDFKSIFSKLTHYGFDGWAILEWECCIKDSDQGAREGASFIQQHMIEKSERAFDDFAKNTTNKELNKRLLGLE